MFNKTVVIVDDEPDIRELLNYNLSKEGFRVKTFPNPISGMEYIRKNNPDIILSDWLMPEMDGLEFCRRLKMNAVLRNIPLIMITCKSDETDIVTALELGADDYLIKPFRIKELIARIKKVIRNHEDQELSGFLESSDTEKYSGNNDHAILNRGPLSINPENYHALLHGKQLNLTISEFKMLLLMAKKPGKVFTRDHLIHYLNGDDYLVTERAVDVKIVGLRKKLGKCGWLICTVRSLGYKFSEEYETK